ncbi:MAG: electron transfer flavoprotein subunit alpha/FixB family protein [Syntrophales bacterium]
MDKILVFVEANGEEPRKVSLELLSEGLKLAETGQFSMEAAFLGKLPEAVREKVLHYTEKLIHVTDPALEDYTAEGYAMAMAGCARETGAKLILGGATQRGRDFLPRVAVLLQTGIASDVTMANWDKTPLTFIRPMYGGRVLAELTFSTCPAIVTVRPNSFGMGAPRAQKGEFVEISVGIPPELIKTSVIKTEETARGKVDLTEAELIVAGGRGLKTADNFRLLEELAQTLGATVGATRSVVDAKWRDQADQIGKSGKTVSPKFYLGAGISGAIHHIMGMDTSRVVLAVNSDPNAIIFKYANYGIVGDLFEVLPAMTGELKKRLGKQTDPH